jgi:hypothetical protein
MANDLKWAVGPQISQLSTKKLWYFVTLVLCHFVT